MSKKKLLFVRIAIIIVIMAAVAGIWILKNADKIKQSNVVENNNMEAGNFSTENTLFELEVTEQVDFKALSEYNIPLIVDYGSDSCIPCKEMAPALKKLNEEFSEKAFVKFVDVWKYNNAANNVPIQVIPTQVLFNADGTPFIPSDELAAEIEFTMYNSKTDNEHLFTTHQGGLTEDEIRKILKEMGVE